MEVQLANFMEAVAKAVYDNLDDKKKPDIFRAWTGRFCTVPLKNDISIKRKPDVLGCDPVILSQALNFKIPKLPFLFVEIGRAHV